MTTDDLNHNNDDGTKAPSQVLAGSSSSSVCRTEEMTTLSTEHGRQLAHKKMNNTTSTRLSDLEQENTRLRARLGVLSKQTDAAHTVAPFVLLARQFLGNAQKVDGIQKSITTLTEPAELLAIQEACADRYTVLIQQQSRGELRLHNDLESNRKARWRERHKIQDLDTFPRSRRIARTKIPYYHFGMNADEMLVMLGKDPNRTFVYRMNDNGSTNPDVIFAVGEVGGTHLVLKDADNVPGEYSCLPASALAPPVDIEAIRAVAPTSGCANECATCVGPPENRRDRRFHCSHFCCESFTDYCISCGAEANESSL